MNSPSLPLPHRLNAKTSSLRKSVLTHELPIGTASADRKAQVCQRHTQSYMYLFLKSPMLSVMFFSISSKVHEDTQFVLATTRDRCIEKEDLASYVSRKREMFLVEYALGVKRDEIRKLEEIAKVTWGRRWVKGVDKGQGKRWKRCSP